MTTRDIRPSTAITTCDVCGRTLLRGERAEAYLQGGARRWVCELCKSRALHEGWIREGTLPSYDAASAGSERRRSLLHRLRNRYRDALTAESSANGDADLQPGVPQDDLPPHSYENEQPPPVPARPRARPRPRPRSRSRETREAADAREPREVREPRHVRAVPASPEHKTASATQLFNASEHTRTVAGVARSLGLPTVAVLPLPGHTSLVNVVVSWELCWYRYEVDLSEEATSVRVAAQGYELEELAPQERLANAVATEHGMLELSG